MDKEENEKVTYSQKVLELERRRIRAVQKVLDGAKQCKVAEDVGVTEGAVSQWVSAYKEKGWDGLKAGSKPGRPIIFKKEHREKLFDIISKTPYSWDYESDLWTVSMTREVLGEQTGTL
ncbi:MAG: helix-turn-helix domain-containing protein, partial [Bacteroidales bacterium]